MKLKVHYKNVWLWMKDYPFTVLVGKEWGTSLALLNEEELRYKERRPIRWEQERYGSR